MRRFVSLFVSLVLALSLGWGSIAHAIEGRAVDPTVATVGHFDGDADQTSGDADKASPHHHAECHGHHVGVPATVSPVPPLRPRMALDHLAADERLIPAAFAPELRPPIA